MLSLAESRFRSGDLAAARELASKTLLTSRGRDEFGTETYTLRLLGEIADASDEAELACESYEASMRLGRERDMRPLVARCHFGLGRLYQRMAKSDQARTHLATATTMYRGMDMQLWLEQAEAELRGLA